MRKSIYVGNLPFEATEEQLRGLFEPFGVVHSATLVNDRETGRPRGFGFVEMDAGGADTAIGQLNGTPFGGRTLQVNEARERAQRGTAAPRRLS